MTMNNLIETVKNLPSENRSQTLLGFVEQVKQLKTCSNVVLARVLYEIEKNEYFKEWTYTEDGLTKNYSSISDFGRIVFEYSSSTTKTFLRIHEKFVVELQVADERLADLSWGNLKIVCPHVNADNLDMVLKLCEGKQKEVREWASQFAEEKNESPPKYSFTCSVDQAEIFDQALDVSRDQIAKMGGSPPNDSHVWEYICSQFLMISDEVMSLQDYLKLLESRFDVKLGLVSDVPLPSGNNSPLTEPKDTVQLADLPDYSLEEDLPEYITIEDLK
jgi:hypothetical protein